MKRGSTHGERAAGCGIAASRSTFLNRRRTSYVTATTSLHRSLPLSGGATPPSIDAPLPRALFPHPDSEAPPKAVECAETAPWKQIQEEARKSGCLRLLRQPESWSRSTSGPPAAQGKGRQQRACPRATESTRIPPLETPRSPPEVRAATHDPRSTKAKPREQSMESHVQFVEPKINRARDAISAKNRVFLDCVRNSKAVAINSGPSIAPIAGPSLDA
jgi:hypothetical protein